MSWSGGDWLCGACQHVNFKKRDSCQKCNFPKYGSQADMSSYSYTNNANHNRTTEVLAGDWYCQSMSCGAHNYASRTSCFRCGSSKCDYGAVGYGATSDMMMMMGSGSYSNSEQQQLLPGWKAGDWVCMRPGCGLHNYACRMECFKCKTPRDFGGSM